jgi:hypothetical protein
MHGTENIKLPILLIFKYNSLVGILFSLRGISSYREITLGEVVGIVYYF